MTRRPHAAAPYWDAVLFVCGGAVFVSAYIVTHASIREFNGFPPPPIDPGLALRQFHDPLWTAAVGFAGLALYLSGFLIGARRKVVISALTLLPAGAVAAVGAFSTGAWVPLALFGLVICIVAVLRRRFLS
jgi:type IV secretory pathway TrbD component